MSLATLKPRLGTANTLRVQVLDTKAGATPMERGRAWMAKRHRVAMAHNYQCKCGAVWVSTRDHIDHIIPREQGGSNDESNLQPLCRPCHDEKTKAEATARSKR